MLIVTARYSVGGFNTRLDSISLGHDQHPEERRSSSSSGDLTLALLNVFPQEVTEQVTVTIGPRQAHRVGYAMVSRYHMEITATPVDNSQLAACTRANQGM